MYLVAYASLLLALLFALGGAGAGVAQLWQDRNADLGWLEKAHLGVTLCLTVASGILLTALINCDFSVDYVASYTDRVLPLFYRLTAFWAGQSGRRAPSGRPGPGPSPCAGRCFSSPPPTGP